jgi:hypothetical protein
MRGRPDTCFSHVLSLNRRNSESSEEVKNQEENSLKLEGFDAKLSKDDVLGYGLLASDDVSKEKGLHSLNCSPIRLQ